MVQLVLLVRNLIKLGKKLGTKLRGKSSPRPEAAVSPEAPSAAKPEKGTQQVREAKRALTNIAEHQTGKPRRGAKRPSLAELGLVAKKIEDKARKALEAIGLKKKVPAKKPAGRAPRKTVDDLLQEAAKTKTTKSKQFERSGGLSQANQNFTELVGSSPVKTSANGLKSAALPDGTTVSVRSFSREGLPTLQMTPPTGKQIKIRYK